MKRILLITAGLPATLALGATAFAQDGDQVSEGETLFQQLCQQCHSLEEGQNGLGPHLNNIVGREAAAVDDFDYSEAMEESDITWTPDNIDQFIADPQAFIPGNRMPFTGMPDEDERTAVVAFLEDISESDGESDAGSEGAAPNDSPTSPEAGEPDDT
ncbi:c-type cytochrome [Chelativorans sp. YIM 93263]|uniref:c-type cytochrome n=1 Tax=Chelativorans sp. YIM 93263 TaxID=2906648 RepID=UPI002379C833|nr:cytochrome c family protein [Chelativorans sp. YIM 93263]